MSTKFLSIKEVVEPIVGGYWGETVDTGAGNARVVRNGDVLESGEIGQKVPERKLSEKEVAKSKLKSGDILITMSGNVGRVARVKEDKHIDGNPYVASNFVKILRANTNILPEYLFFLLRGEQFKDALKKHTRGVAIQNLSVKIFEHKFIPEIPVSKQKEIVMLLEDAESLKQRRDEADKITDELIPAIFRRKFDSTKYKAEKLGQSISYLTSGARGWAQYYSTEPGYKYIRIQNVKDAKLHFSDVQFVNPPESAESKRIKVQQGDLLISITADLGRTAVVDQTTAKEGAYVNQHIALVRLNDEYNPIFVAHFLENEGKAQFLKYGQAAAKKGLNFESIRSLLVPKPPIELQNQFADEVNEILTLKEKQSKSKAGIAKLFSSLLSKSLAQ